MNEYWTRIFSRTTIRVMDKNQIVGINQVEYVPLKGMTIKKKDS